MGLPEDINRGNGLAMAPVNKTESAPKLFVFDFDGTLTTVDTLFCVFIFGLLEIKNWPLIFGEFVRFLGHRDREKFRTRYFARAWKGNSDFAKKSFDAFLTSPLSSKVINRRVFNFLESVVVSNRTIIITANYRIWVEAFLKKHLNVLDPNLKVIGTEYLAEDYTIIKGTEKLNALSQYLSDKKVNDDLEIYNFFDSKSDLYLVELCNFNIVIGQRNFEKLSRQKDKLVEFSSFVIGQRNE